MNQLRVTPVGEKQIRISGIDPVLSDCLFALPEILEQRDTPPVAARLFPDPAPGEPAANLEWHRLLTPELQHLFAEAGSIVVRDLTNTQPDPHGKHLFQVVVATEHLAAWMSALNQARLILGELHNITEADMDKAEFDLHQTKDLALFRIHVLGYLLQLLIELQSPPAA